MENDLVGGVENYIELGRFQVFNGVGFMKC